MMPGNTFRALLCLLALFTTAWTLKTCDPGETSAEAFARYDLDKNSLLDEQELRKMSESGHYKTDQMLLNFDDDKDGSLTLRQYRALSMGGYAKGHRMVKLFYEYDLNGDDSITAAELQKTLTSKGVETSTRKVKSVISRVDSDCNKELSFNEMTEIGDKLPL